MAIMIPTDSYFDAASGEKNMFEALSKLPDDYYVFHSYRLVQLIPDKGLNENEIDFLVFNPNYGCLFIECKNSKVERTETGAWNYVSNYNGVEKRIPMKDPFNQAFTGQHNLFNKFRDTYPEYKNLIDGCKFMVAVWFPKYTKSEIEELPLGANVTKEIILTREALLYPKETLKQIESIMERMNKVHLVCKYEEELIVENSPGYKHGLSHSDAMLFYNKVLCPTFRAIVNVKKDFENTYIQLLEEQYVILEFLGHQRTAAISGASGTGKTLVAVERARRLSYTGAKVLFLCYNRILADWLNLNYSKELPNVSFYTIDAYGCKKMKKSLDKLNYFDLHESIMGDMLNHEFEYKHIVVDEGQDFGIESLDISNILELFSSYGSGYFDDKDTSFFIFYDKNQLVNSNKIPKYLSNVDSKLTLYKNCRNTKNIANTAYSLLDVRPVLNDNAWLGEVPKFILYDGAEELKNKINKVLNDLISKNEMDKVIITCAESIKKSCVFPYLEEEAGNKTHLYTGNGKRTKTFTSARFKGLEADNVLIVDISNDTFKEENKTFYVAATRAKKNLFIFLDKNSIDLDNIINSRFTNSFKSPNKVSQLVLAMHGLLR